MNTRSKRLLLLAKKQVLDSDTKPLLMPEGNLIFLPKYEGTKGLSAEYRQIAIEKGKEFENKESESEDKSSESEYTPSLEQEAAFGKLRKRKMVNIVQNIIIQERSDINRKPMNRDCLPLDDQEEVGKKIIMRKYLQSVQSENMQTGIEECQDRKDVKMASVPYTTDNEKSHFFQSTSVDFQSNNQVFDDDVLKINNTPHTKTESATDNNKENIDNIEMQAYKRDSKETVNSTEKTSERSFEKMFRKNNPTNNIEIIAATKKNGKRVRNKTHVCYFCNKAIINMARHFESVHGNEPEIQKCLSHPKNSKERKHTFLEIIRVGDFYYNCNVLSTKTGELILLRRPTPAEAKFVKIFDYGPCPNCLGFLLKKHIWHHIKFNCKEKVLDEPNEKHVIAESNAILADIFGLGFTKEFHTSILSNFKADEIGDICKNDVLIMKYGAMQYEKFGNTQNELIRQTMRQLARLVISLKKISNNITCSLSDFLAPDKFDIIIQATKEISMNKFSNDTSRPEFHTPSLALKIGYALKKCVSIERGAALRAGNIKRNKSLLSFLHLMKMEWSIRVSSNALSTLYRRKFNSVQLLPITNDLVKLSNYLDCNITAAKTKLKENRNIHTWTRLATLTLSRIILFNKRRSGEASKMKLSDYISRPSWEQQNTQEIREALTPIEQKLAETLIIVEIEGKRGRKVPVILTPAIKESIDILIRHRDECQIYMQNKHVFARSKPSILHLRGHDCLRKICEEIVLENPGAITGTKLRKYVATVCQLFNLSENEYDWLARHLGHDIKVHRDFYRIHESAIELTKISRLLIAVDKGEANKFAGKPLDEINIQELPQLEEDDKDNESVEDSDDEDKVEYTENNAEFVGEGAKGTNKKCKKKTSKKEINKTMWTSAEKEAVIKFFKLNIKKGIVPGKNECERCKEQNPVLSERDWKKIKFCVKNEISKIKKIIKK